MLRGTASDGTTISYIEEMQKSLSCHWTKQDAGYYLELEYADVCRCRYLGGDEKNVATVKKKSKISCKGLCELLFILMCCSMLTQQKSDHGPRGFAWLEQFWQLLSMVYLSNRASVVFRSVPTFIHPPWAFKAYIIIIL